MSGTRTQAAIRTPTFLQATAVNRANFNVSNVPLETKPARRNPQLAKRKPRSNLCQTIGASPMGGSPACAATRKPLSAHPFFLLLVEVPHAASRKPLFARLFLTPARGAAAGLRAPGCRH